MQEADGTEHVLLPHLPPKPSDLLPNSQETAINARLFFICSSVQTLPPTNHPITTQPCLPKIQQPTPS